MAGIDYGMGQTNIDKENGIRYGIIPANALTQWVWESFEPNYGEPTCPKCGNAAQDGAPEDDDGYEVAAHCCYDYHCPDCNYIFDGEEAYSEECLSNDLDTDEYKASIDQSNDCWVFKSPYYTRADFCSPCAPGACYLTNPDSDGAKAYCMGADWFDDENPCPYTIWRVDTNELVYTPAQSN